MLRGECPRRCGADPVERCHCPCGAAKYDPVTGASMCTRDAVVINLEALEGIVLGMGLNINLAQIIQRSSIPSTRINAEVICDSIMRYNDSVSKELKASIDNTLSITAEHTEVVRDLTSSLRDSITQAHQREEQATNYLIKASQDCKNQEPVLMEIKALVTDLTSLHDFNKGFKLFHSLLTHLGTGESFTSTDYLVLMYADSELKLTNLVRDISKIFEIKETNSETTSVEDVTI